MGSNERRGGFQFVLFSRTERDQEVEVDAVCQEREPFLLTHAGTGRRDVETN